jgi:hypothetical protein
VLAACSGSWNSHMVGAESEHENSSEYAMIVIKMKYSTVVRT